MGASNTVSEDTEKILGLIIVTLSFISIPFLLFLFAVMIYLNANQIIRFFNTGVVIDAMVAVLLAIFNAVLFFVIRALIRWVRR